MKWKRNGHKCENFLAFYNDILPSNFETLVRKKVHVKLTLTTDQSQNGKAKEF